MKTRKLTISIWLWMRLIKQLRKRGHGQRESGAFLLGRNGQSRITHFICYDDLDPMALDTGIVVFHGHGFVPLWEVCRREKMQVLADVHTHSDEWTGQSEADRTHPMVGQKGHVSLIVPHYGMRNLLELGGVGIYEYVGNHQWIERPDYKFQITLL